MKFLFCGNGSCPEWFLAESAILTKIVIEGEEVGRNNMLRLLSN